MSSLPTHPLKAEPSHQPPIKPEASHHPRKTDKSPSPPPYQFPTASAEPAPYQFPTASASAPAASTATRRTVSKYHPVPKTEPAPYQFPTVSALKAEPAPYQFPTASALKAEPAPYQFPTASAAAPVAAAATTTTAVTVNFDTPLTKAELKAPPAKSTGTAKKAAMVYCCEPVHEKHGDSTRSATTIDVDNLDKTELSSLDQAQAAADQKPVSNTSMMTADPLLDLERGLGVDKKDAENGHYLPRLVLRNRPFGQSNNKVHIQHNQGWKIYALLKHNWFHTLLRWPTSRSLLMLMFSWTSAILVFAGLYVWHDNQDATVSCGLGAVGHPLGFGGGFAFSLETCTTVGYGLPNGVNSFFEEECGSLQVLIYAQMAWSMVFNAFLLAFLYARFGRSETRSNQVINSKQALISSVDGQVRLQVRLFDADAQHPVVEAHVRMYCVMNHRPVPRPLRLLQPDDDFGGMLFLSFPTVVSHHVDLYSLLHPPTVSPLGGMKPHGLVLRSADGSTANRDDIVCPTCGESYGTLKRWKNHVRYQQIVERKDEYPVEGTHLALDLDELEKQAGIKPTKDLAELKEYFRTHVSEVVCVVEGIDPLQSGTFQSLQSYRFEDIVWDENSQFAPCMTVVNGPDQKKTGERMFQVDLDRYHDIVLDTHTVREQQKRAEEEAQEAAALMTAQSVEGSTTSYGGSIGGSGGDIEAAGTIGTMEDNSLINNMPPKKRSHRRVKSSSRRACDALFVPDEDISHLVQRKGHPFMPTHSVSMPI